MLWLPFPFQIWKAQVEIQGIFCSLNDGFKNIIGAPDVGPKKEGIAGNER